jgi:hypothetical protein
MKTWFGAAALLLACSACGPSVAQFTVLSEGTGEAVVTHINHAIGNRYTFGLMDPVDVGKVSQLLEGSYTGTTTLTGGQEVLIYATAAGDVLLSHSGVGDALEFTWGDDTDLAAAPVLSLRLPLKLGAAWRTFDEKGTPFYEYRVEQLERVTVPAGTFDTARVAQLNLRQGTQVNRWYTQEVGLVQRNQSLLFAYTLAPEAK